MAAQRLRTAQHGLGAWAGKIGLGVLCENRHSFVGSASVCGEGGGGPKAGKVGEEIKGRSDKSKPRGWQEKEAFWAGAREQGTLSRYMLHPQRVRAGARPRREAARRRVCGSRALAGHRAQRPASRCAAATLAATARLPG